MKETPDSQSGWDPFGWNSMDENDFSAWGLTENPFGQSDKRDPSDWSSMGDFPSWSSMGNPFGPSSEESPFDQNSKEDHPSDYDTTNFEKRSDIDMLSQPMKDFFERQGYDTISLPTSLCRPLLNVSEIGDMFFGKGSWREAKRENIFVGNIVGSQGIYHNNATLASFMSYLYRDYDEPSSYNGRDIQHLEDDYRKTAQKILNDITPSEYVSDGKYYFLCGDGNHRLFFLATALELELAECGNDEVKKSEIVSKYTIPAMICPSRTVKDLGAILEKRTESSK